MALDFSSPIHFMEYALLRLAAGVLLRIPYSWAVLLVRGATSALMPLFSKRLRIARENLRLALGPIDAPTINRIARASVLHQAMAFLDLIRIPLSVNRPDQILQAENLDLLLRAYEKQRGLILVTGHLGSWENLALLSSLTGAPSITIVRPLKNPLIDHWINKLRRQTGNQPLSRDSALKPALSHLRKGGALCLFVDQWSGHHGLWMEFFGRQTSSTSLPVKLANKTGAPIFPIVCVRTSEEKFKVVVMPEIKIAEGANWEEDTAQTIQLQMENIIRKYPDQWIWTHKRWKPRERHIPGL